MSMNQKKCIRNQLNLDILVAILYREPVLFAHVWATH